MILGNNLPYILIGIAFIFGLFFLLKNEFTRMITLYVLAVIVIISGVFCGAGVFNDLKAESYVVGSINISNKFSQESFSYNASSVVFYYNEYSDVEELYEFTIDLIPTEDFNGKEKTYETYVNDFNLINANYDVGYVSFVMPIDFYSIENEILCCSEINGSIKFYNDRTTLSLSVIGDEQAQFVTRYFEDNGLRIKIIEKI